MKKKNHIMVVDDMATNRSLLTMIMEDDFDVDEAASGRECLDKVAQQQPDLILLDIQMPEMNGYQVCTQLRKQKATEILPIIFVSGMDSTEERLKAFESGGNDFVIKPVDTDELLEKIKLHLQQSEATKQAKRDAKDAMMVAMEAMTTSSELGQIIQLVKEAPSLNSQQSVVNAIFEMIHDFELSVCAMVIGDRTSFFGCDPKSMEAKVLECFQVSLEKIVHVGVRTIIKGEHIMLLIKNMPLDDENRYGRLKDHLAVLVDIADGRISTLQAELAILDQRKIFLKKIIVSTEKQLKQTSQNLNQHEKTIINTMEHMVNELEDMLFGLGLEDDQEAKLRGLTARATLKLENTSFSSSQMDQELNVILQSLHEFMEDGDT